MFREKIDGPGAEGGWELFTGEMDKVKIEGGEKECGGGELESSLVLYLS